LGAKNDFGLSIGATKGSPNDGKYLAVANVNTIEVQEISTGRSLYSLIYRDALKEEKVLYGAEFSPDAKKLLIAGSNDVQLIDLATKNVVWKVPAPVVGVQIQFSEDGKLVALGHTSKTSNATWW
jgi:WD40 repeat protein